MDQVSHILIQSINLRVNRKTQLIKFLSIKRLKTMWHKEKLENPNRMESEGMEIGE
jgi:hypothetical protein